MKITFDTVEEYDDFHSSVHSAILFWKKVKQDAQGKICMQCDGTQTHYSVEDAEDEMKKAARVLMTIEDSAHPVYDFPEDDNFTSWDDVPTRIANGREGESYSCIITKTLKDELVS